MAVIYSEQDSYIRKNIFSEKVSALYWISALIIMFVGAWKFLYNRDLSFIAAIYFLLFFVIPVAGLLYFFKRTDRSIGKYQSGQRGQRNVVNLLRIKLPDSYSVFAGLQLPKMHGDVDCVIVGQYNLFALEVKNIRGVVTIRDDKLLINGKEVTYKNFLNQTFAGARAVQQFVTNKVGEKVEVVPILVFTHPQSYVNVGFRKYKGVHVMHISSLIKFMRTNRGTLIKDPFKIQLELARTVGEDAINKK
jgi:hypothetical protein